MSEEIFLDDIPSFTIAYEELLSSISSYDNVVQDHLVMDFRIAYDKMLKRRTENIANMKPGHVLQRCPANCYFDGPFTVYWHEMKISLEKFNEKFYRNNYI